jgi:hypothetical protein
MRMGADGMKSYTVWPLLLFYAGVEGWVLSFPLLGPMLFPFALYRGIEPGPAANGFLLMFAVSLAGWGIVLAKYPWDGGRLRQFLLLDILACLALDALLLLGAEAVWQVVFAALGVLAAFPTVVWLTLVTQRVETQRTGWNLGLTGFCVQLVVYLAGLLTVRLSPLQGFAAIHLLLLAALAVLLRRPGPFEFGGAPVPDHARSEGTHVLRILYPLLFALYVIEGLLSKVVSSYVSLRFPDMPDRYSAGVLMIALILAGILGDRFGLRALVAAGLVSLGSACALAVGARPAGVAVVVHGLLAAGFAVMNVLVLFALARWVPRHQPARYIGIGLGVYVVAVFVGGVLGQWMIS